MCIHSICCFTIFLYVLYTYILYAMHIAYGHPPLQDHMITPHHLPARVDFSSALEAVQNAFSPNLLSSFPHASIKSVKSQQSQHFLYFYRLFSCIFESNMWFFSAFFHADFAMTLLWSDPFYFILGDDAPLSTYWCGDSINLRKCWCFLWTRDAPDSCLSSLHNNFNHAQGSHWFHWRGCFASQDL